MSPKYDLFERFPDGSSLWRACVIGLDGARLHMKDLAVRSSNQFYAMHVATGKIEFLRSRPGDMTAPLKMGSHSKAAVA
jgi:hypothetical protein